MKTGITILSIFLMTFIVRINAQDSFSSKLDELKSSKSKMYIIPVSWIDSIDIPSVLISINPRWEDTLTSVIDNYDWFIIENTDVYAEIYPYYSSVRWQTPIVYIRGCETGGNVNPLKVHISHLSNEEQKHYRNCLTDILKQIRKKSR